MPGQGAAVGHHHRRDRECPLLLPEPHQGADVAPFVGRVVLALAAVAPGEHLPPVPIPGGVHRLTRKPRQLAARGKRDRRARRVEVAEVGGAGDVVDVVRALRECDRLEDARSQRIGQRTEALPLRRVA